MSKRNLDKSKIEIRNYDSIGFEFRKDEAGVGRIKGHAAVFDKWSEDLGGFKERIAPGAFTKTLNEADVRMLWDHNSQYVLGRKSAGTLQLMEDRQGLYFENSPPETTWYSDLKVSMERGDITQMSFGFQVIKDEWSSDWSKRTILEVRLLEISVVTFPAYPQTSAKVRSLPTGITLDRLAEIIDMRENGQELGGEAIAELRAATDYLKSIEPEEPPSSTPPAVDPPKRSQYRNILTELEASIALYGIGA